MKFELKLFFIILFYFCDQGLQMPGYSMNEPLFKSNLKPTL